MYSQGQIEDFVIKNNIRITSKKALLELHNILLDDEALIWLIDGFLKKIHQENSNGGGLAILTNKRIIFFRKSFIGRITNEELPINKVTSISYKKGFIYTDICIKASSEESIIQVTDKGQADAFVSLVREAINKTSEPKSQKETKPEFSALDEIKKLFELKQMGALTEDEFIEQKSKLLSNKAL